MVYAEFCGSHAKATKICANYQARPEWLSFSKMCLLESDTSTINDDVSSTASASTRLHLDDYLIKVSLLSTALSTRNLWFLTATLAYTTNMPIPTATKGNIEKHRYYLFGI
jgi:hypothetical protein